MKMFKWTVEFEIDETWVTDGFNLTDERVKDMIDNELEWAFPHEFNARVITAPPQEEILKAQGFIEQEKG